MCLCAVSECRCTSEWFVGVWFVFECISEWFVGVSACVFDVCCVGFTCVCIQRGFFGVFAAFVCACCMCVDEGFLWCGYGCRQVEASRSVAQKW